MKEGLTPKGLRVKIPLSVLKLQHGERLRCAQWKEGCKKSNLEFFCKGEGSGYQDCEFKITFKTVFFFLEKLGSKDGELGVEIVGKVKGEG